VNDRFARPGPGSHQSSRGFDSSDPFIPERHISSSTAQSGASATATRDNIISVTTRKWCCSMNVWL